MFPFLKSPDLTPAHLTVFAGQYYLLGGLWFCGLKDERYVVQQWPSKSMHFSRDAVRISEPLCTAIDEEGFL